MKSDFLVIGGGIVGLSIAMELKKRLSDAKIVILEKEKSCGMHASGRNSGVLHAGFYYAADSLKARFTADGNRSMTRFCEDHGLPVRKCGKLVVAQDESDLPWLDELLNRARENGVALEDIPQDEAEEIEPRVRTFRRALYSPSTSCVDPGAVMKKMAQQAVSAGVILRTGVRCLRATGRNAVETGEGYYQTDFLVNAAGLYADKIAADCGFSRDYRILPFKGLYLYADRPDASLRTNIYPVPDLRNPFLGVHFTVTASGRTKIGPTAIPAFWREQYGGLKNFNVYEIADIVMRQAGLLAFSNFDFKRLAWEELRKYSKGHLADLACSLVKNFERDHFRQWGPPGIRAQLLNIRDRKLEMDFVIEGDDKSLHVLNAVSPAFTCAFPFAAYVCDRILQVAAICKK